MLCTETWSWCNITLGCKRLTTRYVSSWELDRFYKQGRCVLHNGLIFA